MKCKWFSPSCSGFILTHLNSKYSPGFKQLDMGAAQYNHSVLLVDTGSCPVQPQSTGGYWELPSLTSLLLVDTGVLAITGYDKKKLFINLL